MAKRANTQVKTPVSKTTRSRKRNKEEAVVITAATVAPALPSSPVGAEIDLDSLDSLLADEVLSADTEDDDLDLEIEIEDENDDLDLASQIEEPAPVETTPANNDAELEALMAEIEGDDAPVEASDEDLEKVAGEIALEETRQEIYAKQESTVELKDEPAPSEETKTAKAPKEPREKKERAPRLTLESLPADAFVLTLSDAEVDLEENKATVIARKPTAVKVAEKFENTLLSIAAGKLPSVYTVQTMKLLRKQGGTATSKQIVEDLMSRYGDGTARAQGSQMMQLLPALKIAERSGNSLTLNAESTLAMAIYGIIDGASSAPAEEPEAA
ncbi:hypothetical protein [Magnetospirillum molischianum]|uniref:Uncharacterized protein n=1 Tax=Magnetospirillum molischianum DSM 120 TaxID=1150626 RepID=H8FXY6_MAGML|nr:hypothetical protein [Magnetospirillum molischianum]CCG43224.1 conserved exported hypothetical protein [Magnetospirillum molischianum DSM 120]